MVIRRQWTTRVVLAAVVGGAALLAPVGGRAQQPAGGLRIIVVEGEDAVNIIQQRTAVAPLVEVRDRNNNPVAGALVTFTIQGGQNATFGGGLQSLIVTTNAAGRAAVTGFTPTASGAVQINVAATFQGQAATATITQTNFATAAQAAQAGASGAGGGGLSTTTIAAIAGGAGAGTYFGLKELGVIGVPDIPPPTITSASAFPPGGLVGMLFDFNFSGEVPGHVDRPDATLLWEFGDGTSSSSSVGGPAPPTRVTHVYAAPGTYTARVTITNADGESATAQTTVIVKTLTGRWRVGTGATFYDFVQTAATFSGSFNSGTAVVRSLSGTVNATFPIIRFTESNGASFTGTPSADADTISGTFSGVGTQGGTVPLFRQ